MAHLTRSRKGVLLTALLLASSVAKISGAHQDTRHANLHHALHARNEHNTSDAALVEEALSAIKLINEARVKNSHFNKYEFMSGSTNRIFIPALNASVHYQQQHYVEKALAG
jgi:hypothetical protein